MPSEIRTVDRESIRRLVATRLNRRVAVGDETPLVSGGLLDSMSIVDLILDLQDTFGVEIPASEVQPEDFDTVARIALIVERFRRA